MTQSENPGDLGKGLPVGAPHHRAYVGMAEHYDLVAQTQFNLLTCLGMREDHYLLDIGCGSLRGGRLSIVYLLPRHYFGIEPNRELLKQGIEKEAGMGLIDLKQPRFSHDADFTCTTFGREFDFIMAQAIFVHAVPAQIHRCLTQARMCMRPSSFFIANFSEGERNSTQEKWTYPEHQKYRLSWMEEAADEAGLTCTPIDWFHPSSPSIMWLILARTENWNRAKELAAASHVGALKQEISVLKNRIKELDRVERHPYVRFGLWVKHALRRMTSVVG